MPSAAVAVVLVGGDPVGGALRDRIPRPDYVVAADSGLLAAETLGLRVDALVGDLDSVAAADVEAAVARGTVVDRHPEAKDATDFELALDDAAAHADRIVCVGGAGGRLDHLLANLLLLGSPRFARANVEALVGDAVLQVVHAGSTTRLSGDIGSLVSLFPVGGPAHGVATEGMEYPLRDETLDVGTSRGVSNVLVATEASVSVREGTVLVVQPTGGAR